VILVTGAGGKTGLAVIRAAAAAGQMVRALVHREDQRDRVRAAGAREWVAGDMPQEGTLAQAIRGVRTIYHVCPNVHPDEVLIGQRVIAAARAAGVERIVYHSVLHPQVEAMPHHWNKMRVEALLFESGLAYTILQPASYMQNVLAGWHAIVKEGVYAVPYSVETRLGMVDLEDVAAAAAIVLADRRHDGATYELAGPEALTQTEVAEILTRWLGRPVRVVQISLNEWAARAQSSGLGEYQISALLKMFAYYGRFGFWGNPAALTQVLGRTPTTLEAFVARVHGVAPR
jgi:NAD(P)H dehydrogenase (quinone)